MKLAMMAMPALACGALQAQEMDIPLAVTGSAHPVATSTPSVDELHKSDDYLKAGLSFLKKNLPLRAVDEFNDSVALAPRSENYKALGTAYYQAGNTHKAAWAYRQSLALQARRQAARAGGFPGGPGPRPRRLRHGPLFIAHGAGGPVRVNLLQSLQSLIVHPTFWVTGIAWLSACFLKVGILACRPAATNGRASSAPAACPAPIPPSPRG